jgi:hypothetical protein
MTLSSIPKVLSTFSKHKSKALLIGGQACILYGAAEFSRDIDFAVMVSPENLNDLQKILEELDAERIFYPALSEEVLLKGHACHFRCNGVNVKGLRIDVIGSMRGVDPFHELWLRRREIDLPGIGQVPVIGLADLVKSKKTQRDKDWPMIRKLIEADIYNAPDDPADNVIQFWFAECRTPDLLVLLASKYPEIAEVMLKKRPLISSALSGNYEEIIKLLRDEEDLEREADRQYWTPLKKQLEEWRLRKGP